MDRRTLLFGAAAFFAAAAIPSNLPLIDEKSALEQICQSSIPQQERKKFEGLWGLLLRYNQKRNEVYTERKKELEESQFDPALVSSLEQKADVYWQDVVKFAKENLPGIVKGNDIDYDELKRVSIDQKRVFARYPHIKNPSVQSIILGDLVEEKEEDFQYKNQKIRYGYVKFETAGNNLDNILNKGKSAWWDNKNKVAYVNLTVLKEMGGYIFYYGGDLENKRPHDYRGALIKELYNNIMGEVRKENPVYFNILPESQKNKIFVRKFVNILSDLSIRHERMHYFYPYSSDIEESKKKEKETYLSQIAGDDRFNSAVFLMIYDGGGYEELYKLLERPLLQKAGYNDETAKNLSAEEKLKIIHDTTARISPAERSRMATNILNSL